MVSAHVSGIELPESEPWPGFHLIDQKESTFIVIGGFVPAR